MAQDKRILRALMGTISPITGSFTGSQFGEGCLQSPLGTGQVLALKGFWSSNCSVSLDLCADQQTDCAQDQDLGEEHFGWSGCCFDCNEINKLVDRSAAASIFIGEPRD